MDQITEGLVCNLYEKDNKKYYILKVSDVESEKYALVAPIIANSNPLRYDETGMFCIKLLESNSFELVKDVGIVRTLVEMWTK